MRSRGFSLIEMLVALAIMALVIGGFLSLLDTSSKLSKAQSATADVQENLRYVMAHLIRWTRMAGAGGLPVMVGPGNAVWVPPNGPGRPVAVEVLNNVGTLNIGGRTVVPNTDVLTLRGVFTGEIYDILAGLGGAYSYVDPDGSITIPPLSVTGESQDTSSLDMRIDESKSPPLWVPVVITAIGIDSLTLDGGHTRAFARYGVAILKTKDPTNRTYGFSTTADLEAQHEYLMMNPAGGFPVSLDSLGGVTRIGVVSDRSFFIANDADGVPTLYEHDSVADLTQPVAADMVDLQVALACDTNVDGILTEVAGGSNDEWLFNGSGEDINDTVGGMPGAARMLAYVSEVRVSLVSRIPVFDPQFVQPATEPPTGLAGYRTGEFYFEDGRDLLGDAYKALPAANFRHRSLTERVKLRSLGFIE